MDDEILCLIEDSPMIFHKSLTGCRPITIENKMEAWREITAKVKALGVAVPIDDDLKKKSKDLKSEVLNVVRDQNKKKREAYCQLNNLPMW